MVCALRLDAQSTGAPSVAHSAKSAEPLYFTITEGNIDNYFFRQGPVAAHFLTTSGRSPRLIFAFPAGNTGVGLWFEPVSESSRLSLWPETKVTGVVREDGMRGISAKLQSTSNNLVVRRAILGSIRTLRDSIADGFKPLSPALTARLQIGQPIVYRRDTVDGAHHIELDLALEEGTTATKSGDRITLHAGPSGRVCVQVTALADDAPLTPFPPNGLFNDRVADNSRDRQALEFLASREKFTAGSWRFLTYFGRDTLLSLEMLMPVLKPEVIEDALGSVLERLGPNGEVAHEEAIGEFAALENLKAKPPPADLLKPVFDYKMIDGEFLLVTAAATFLLDSPDSSLRARSFLSRTTKSGERYDEALKKTLALILERAAPFAAAPRFQNLVSLKTGEKVGNWRDSENGLGGGRFPFDVNGVLMPSALKAAGRLYRSGLLGSEDKRAAVAERDAEAWKAAEGLFAVTVPQGEARSSVENYSKALGLNSAKAVSSITRDLTYYALAINADGTPVPVMHTDSGFALFLSDPSPNYLESVAEEITKPFPAGLRTAVGLVVANPVFGDETVRAKFTQRDYHGTVIWSWQQAMMAAGLRRQLQRSDLPVATRQKLAEAEQVLWYAINSLKAQSAGELWSWQAKDGTEILAHYGQGKGDLDESNAAQLWSTVYLAVRPPSVK
jgi:hypothetical protein